MLTALAFTLRGELGKYLKVTEFATLLRANEGLTVVRVQRVSAARAAHGVPRLARVASHVGVAVVADPQLAALHVCATKGQRSIGTSPLALRTKTRLVVTVGGGGRHGAAALSAPGVADGDGAFGGSAAEGDGTALLLRSLHPALGCGRGNCWKEHLLLSDCIKEPNEGRGHQRRRCRRRRCRRRLTPRESAMKQEEPV